MTPADSAILLVVSAPGTSVDGNERCIVGTGILGNSPDHAHLCPPQAHAEGHQNHRLSTQMIRHNILLAGVAVLPLCTASICLC